MATNAERAEALRVAIATGVKSTTVDGLTVTYQDTKAMLDALAVFELRAVVDAGVTPLRHIPLIVTSGHSA